MESPASYEVLGRFYDRRTGHIDYRRWQRHRGGGGPAVAGHGHRVTVTGRNPDRLDRFAKELGSPAELLALAGDAADYDNVRSAVESTVAVREHGLVWQLLDTWIPLTVAGLILVGMAATYERRRRALARVRAAVRDMT